MRIKIIDTKVCESCRTKKCSFVDSIEKQNFYNLKSESTVCPTGKLVTGPDDGDFEKGYICSTKDAKCINCGLCIKQCPYNNLTVEDYEFITTDFEGLIELQYNAIALSYINNILDFAANTNRNKALNFDGYANSVDGEQCFVEVDSQNDSLESCRRIIGDIISYNNNKSTDDKIFNGLIVLKELPKVGSRDIYTLLEKMLAFPATKNFNIYFSTFDVLRHLNLFAEDKTYTFDEGFFNPRQENTEDYITRINSITNV